MERYIIGADVGIGSVGWSIINLDEQRIEDFGVRLFDSGEIVDNNRKKRKSQKRRAFRSMRRLVRRRAHRIVRIKALLEKTGLVSTGEIEAYYEAPQPHPLALRVKGLAEKLTPQELAAAIIHISKHRGYNDFFRMDEEELKSLSDEERKDYKRDVKSTEKYAELMASLPPETTPAQMYLTHPLFQGAFGLNYRNNGSKAAEEYVLVPREAVRAECRRILEQQAQYYPQLTQTVREQIETILFHQRDFEDGPGQAGDKSRKYQGFIDKLGMCTFYKDQVRGARYTVLGDLYVLVNRLSQNRYCNKFTGELVFSAEANREIINTALMLGEIDFNEIKRILKKYSIEMINTKGEDSPNACLAYIRMIKPILEGCGYDWQKLIAEDVLDVEASFLNRIGVALSENRTPQRRVRVLKEKGLVPEAAVKLAQKKTNGTVSVCNRYMRDAVEAFLDGESYGNFQARCLKEQEQAHSDNPKHDKLPPIRDEEYMDNPVVFRSINETRKLINAIVGKYGTPYAMNIEIAADLSRSFAERAKIERENRENEKNTQRVREEIAALLNTTNEVNGTQVERFKLGESQQWKCPYCGQPIAKEIAIRPGDRTYELDHIIPFSLILDNTLNNKVLVHGGCNQKKGKRTPLMYLGAGELRQQYLKWVNDAYRAKRITKKKLDYMLQPDLDYALLDEWKTRNLNDTRYMAKYLVRYISDNLRFASDAKEPVTAVKGAVTSRLRRVWLNRDTWGDDKAKLRETSDLHHAVDAVVIANCTKKHIELAEESLRLQRVYRDAGRQITPEYTAHLEEAVSRISKFYHMSPARVRELLQDVRRVPALLPDLRNEVDLRFCDCDANQEAAYRSRLAAYYQDDPAFAQNIRLPLVSRKPERKFSGEATASKAIPLVEARQKGYRVKEIGENNATGLPDASYYCLEVYLNQQGETRLRGIKYSALKKAGKKLVLREAPPADYGTHVTYLFKNDYIRIINKRGERKFEGYYLSVYDMKAGRICAAGRTEGRLEKSIGISKTDKVCKLDISILGERGGEIKGDRPLPAE